MHCQLLLDGVNKGYSAFGNVNSCSRIQINFFTMKKLYFLISMHLLPFLVAAQNVTIPDANFKAALVANTDINTDGDGEIQVSEAEAFSGAMDVSGLSIADMTGVEAFISLRYLICSNNSLTSLDVSMNTALEDLQCQSNQLSSLDLTVNTLLSWLDCSFNQLVDLDVRSNNLLSTLYCSNNQLSKLDIRNGNNSQIANFIATNNPLLTCISVDDVDYATTNWTNIDVGVSFNTDCGALPVHIPDSNFKTALLTNVKINTNNDSEIQYEEAWAYTDHIYVSGLGIADMTGLEAFTSLTKLYCSNNQLTSLNVSANTELTVLWCFSNQIGSLDVSGNISISNLNCSSNLLSNLDVSANSSLDSLACASNLLSSLDIIYNPIKLNF